MLHHLGCVSRGPHAFRALVALQSRPSACPLETVCTVPWTLLTQARYGWASHTGGYCGWPLGGPPRPLYRRLLSMDGAAVGVPLRPAPSREALPKQAGVHQRNGCCRRPGASMHARLSGPAKRPGRVQVLLFCRCSG